METIKKIVLSCVLVSIGILNCAVNQQEQCYLDAERNGNDGLGCAPGLIIISAIPPSNKSYQSILNVVTIACLQSYETDKRCRAKSKYIPVPSF